MCEIEKKCENFIFRVYIVAKIKKMRYNKKYSNCGKYVFCDLTECRLRKNFFSAGISKENSMEGFL